MKEEAEEASVEQVDIGDMPRPVFWERLSPEDQNEYITLRDDVQKLGRRTKSAKAFRTIIKRVKRYVVKGDSTDCDRGLVCGLIWLSSGLAINTHQLTLAIGKCKSSINGFFQCLGYGTVPSGADAWSDLVKAYPFMAGQFALLRQWTIRRKLDPTNDVKLADIVQQIQVEREVPPPAPSEDVHVASYLKNSSYTLGEMTRALILDSGRQVSDSPEKERGLDDKNENDVEDNGFDENVFFQDSWEQVETFGE
jgi:hypothetical protein